MIGHKVINAVLFQLTWFACVIGGARGTSLWGALALALLAGQALARPPRRDALLLALGLGAFGFALETLWIRLGVLDYGSAFAPPWIVLLWLAVGLCLHHSLSAFQARPWLGGLLAAAAAPFSYLAGAGLGAVDIGPAWSLLAVSLVWLVVFHWALGAARRPLLPSVTEVS